MNPNFEPIHIPVLKQEILDYFEGISQSSPVFLDGTAGEGGHSYSLLEKFPESRVILLDRDKEMLERATRRLERFEGRFISLHCNFSEFQKEDLLAQGLESLQGILLDFGISTYHIKGSLRGFSFQADEPLDMRLSSEGKTASDILNHYKSENLEKIFLDYGEENWSRKIAQNIVEVRRKKPFRTTKDLNELVEKTIPRKFWPPRVHPAFRIYQALRIEVNSELSHIARGLEQLPLLLSPGGILAAISFHSLEDRITKQTLKRLAERGSFRILTKKPLEAREEEVESNPASRSAKLRVLEAVK